MGLAILGYTKHIGLAILAIYLSYGE